MQTFHGLRVISGGKDGEPTGLWERLHAAGHCELPPVGRPGLHEDRVFWETPAPLQRQLLGRSEPRKSHETHDG